MRSLIEAKNCAFGAFLVARLCQKSLGTDWMVTCQKIGLCMKTTEKHLSLSTWILKTREDTNALLQISREDPKRTKYRFKFMLNHGSKWNRKYKMRPRVKKLYLSV